ncbi:MAG: TIR domain-containing protein [Methanothrix sp.]|jgi:hypothetical protein|nr:TIR domain-containing protein [Methanothrix sp.]
MVQIFVSHTHKDIDFCNEFDVICAREGIKAFRSEFETISPPAWPTIKNAINNSVALFLLVGKGLVNNQQAQDDSWKYTQNWIAYEIGVACQKGIDVWAICDNVKINFPMPYINNYIISGLNSPMNSSPLREVFKGYVNNKSYMCPNLFKQEGHIYCNTILCHHTDCKIFFNLLEKIEKEKKITCPQCLRDLILNSHPYKIGEEEMRAIQEVVKTWFKD